MSHDVTLTGGVVDNKFTVSLPALPAFPHGYSIFPYDSRHEQL
jgi:hypothetical protein